MPIQLFESEDHAFTYAQARPSPPRSLIDSICEYLSIGLPTGSDGRWSQAVDVGAGSGQTTFLFTDRFSRILGVDISAAQIAEANKRNVYSNISFKVSSAESIPLEDGSVSLLTASQCLHWLDLKSFYHEVDRLLAPGGVFATFGYLAYPMSEPIDLCNGFSGEGADRNNKLAQLIKKTYIDLGEMNYWKEPETSFLNSKYPGLEMPFKEFQRIDTIVCPINYSGQNYLNYITSWSAYNALAKKEPKRGEQFLDEIVSRMQTILNTEDVHSFQIDLDFEFFLLMSRKPPTTN